MSRDQQKFLEERIGQASRKHRDRRPSSPKTPVNVRTAQRVIRAWEREQRLRQEKYNASIGAAYRKAREAILFREPKDALKAVEQFERMKF